MKVLILCLLIGSIAAINQSQKDFKEVATSRSSSGCVDRAPRLPSECKKLKFTCSKFKSQCNKALYQAAKPAGKKCQNKIRKSDAKKKINQFCARSCSMCTDGNWGQWGDITPCSKTCGGGTGTRTRLCDNPPQKGEGADCPGSNTITVNCNEELCPERTRPTQPPKSSTTPAPKSTPAPKAVFSLKEYHKQVDIFKKSIDEQHKAIKKLGEKLLSQDALLDNQRSLIQGLKQNGSTMRGRVDTLEDFGRDLSNTAVRSCSQDSDCAEPLHFCLNGWCSVTECITDSQCTSSSKPKCHDNICKCRSNSDCGWDLLGDLRGYCKGGACYDKECSDSWDCTDYNNPFCNSGACIKCNGRSCTAQQPYCANNTCGECRLDHDCGDWITVDNRVVPTAARPYCADATCVECNGDKTCPGSTPRCVEHACEECANDLDCNWQTEYCDREDHSCKTVSGYKFMPDRKCSGNMRYDQIIHTYISSSPPIKVLTNWDLGAASIACNADSSCGCFWSRGFVTFVDSAEVESEYNLVKGTGTMSSAWVGAGAGAWVKS